MLRIEGVASYTRPRFWQKDPATVVGSIRIQLALAPSSVFDDASSRAGDTRHFANVEKVTARVRRTLRNHIGGLDELTIQAEKS